MKKLICLFQERLNISRLNATFRVVMMFIFVLCSLFIIVITFVNFPYQSTVTMTVPNNNRSIVKLNENKNKQFFSKDELFNSSYLFCFYKINKISVSKRYLIIEKIRIPGLLFWEGMVLPLLLLLIFMMLALATQFKRVGYGYNDNGILEIKFLEVWI